MTVQCIHCGHTFEIENKREPMLECPRCWRNSRTPEAIDAREGAEFHANEP